MFVGYRREDVPDAAHWLVRELERRYGKGNVFLDMDRISPGRPYAEVIAEWVAEADVFIAVIGPGWLGAETDGVRRIKQPNDPVRGEVESAMRVGKPVIPLLFEDAPLPTASDLPDSLAGLPDVQAQHVTREHFDADVGRLQRAIDEIVGLPPDSPSQPRWWASRRTATALVAVAVIALVAGGILLATKSSPKPAASVEARTPAAQTAQTVASTAAGNNGKTVQGTGAAPAPPAPGARTVVTRTASARTGTTVSRTGTTASKTGTTASKARTGTGTGTTQVQTVTASLRGKHLGANQVVGTYWSDIEHEQFTAAWGLLDGQAKATTKESEHEFVEGHKQEGVTSASFTGSSSYEGGSARVDVSSLTTRDVAHGCRKWNGYYVMKVDEDRWLIDEAKIEPEAC